MRSFSEMPVQKIIESNLAPHMVRFGLSTNCNYNCTMCCGIHSPLRNFEKKNININLEKIFETFDYLRKSWTSWVLFSWVWEPFLHPNIYDILSYISRNFIIVIQTNLSLANINKIQNLDIKHHLTLSVNFNAISKKAYNNIYGNQPYSTLSLVLKKAHELNKNRKITIKLIYIVSSLNKQDVIESIKVADKFGFDLHLEFSNEFDDRASVINLNPWEKLQLSAEVQEHISKRPEKMKNIINTDEFMIQGKGNRTWLEKISYCNAPYLYARIEEDWRVFTCNNLADAYCMWNINEQSFENIWKSEKYQMLRKKSHEGDLLNTCCHNNEDASGGNYKIRYFMNQ